MTAGDVRARLSFINGLKTPEERSTQRLTLWSEYLTWIANSDAIYSSPTQVKKIAEIFADYKGEESNG